MAAQDDRITIAMAIHTYGIGDLQAANRAQPVRKNMIVTIALSRRSGRRSLID
jgi:hypothetical protein